MTIFRSNATTVAKKSYADRLGSIKSMFQTAHSKASALYDEMQKEIEAKKAQRELIKGFIRTLENIGTVAEEFDAGLWCGLVDHVTVTDKDNIVFTFKNGLETKVS